MPTKIIAWMGPRGCEIAQQSTELSRSPPPSKKEWTREQRQRLMEEAKATLVAMDRPQPTRGFSTAPYSSSSSECSEEDHAETAVEEEEAMSPPSHLAETNPNNNEEAVQEPELEKQQEEGSTATQEAPQEEQEKEQPVSSSPAKAEEPAVAANQEEEGNVAEPTAIVTAAAPEAVEIKEERETVVTEVQKLDAVLEVAAVEDEKKAEVAQEPERKEEEPAKREQPTVAPYSPKKETLLSKLEELAVNDSDSDDSQ